MDICGDTAPAGTGAARGVLVAVHVAGYGRSRCGPRRRNERMRTQAPALSLNGASARAQMPPQSHAAVIVMH